MRILITTDVFFHPLSNVATSHSWLVSLLAASMKGASVVDTVDLMIDVLPTLPIDADLFPQHPYQPCAGADRLALEEQLAPYLNAYDLVVCFEPSRETRAWLHQVHRNVMELFLHPVRYHKDWLFAAQSTNSLVDAALHEASIPPADLAVLAAYWTSLINERTQPLDLTGATALVIGQTSSDLSVWDGRRMLGLADFTDELRALGEQFDTVLLKPHPYDPEAHRHVMSSVPNMHLATENVYRYLAHKAVSVTAISSSVVSEARYFGRNASYLWQPLFPDAAPMHCIGKHVFTSAFWQTALEGVPYNAARGAEVFVHNSDAELWQVKRQNWSYQYLHDLVHHRPKPSGLWRKLKWSFTKT